MLTFSMVSGQIFKAAVFDMSIEAGRDTLASSVVNGLTFRSKAADMSINHI